MSAERDFGHATEDDGPFPAGEALARLEALVREQAWRLDAMGKVMERLVHDFNNILTLIIGYTSLLAKGGNPELAAEALSSIDQAAARAAHLTEEMTRLAAESRDVRSATPRSGSRPP